MEPECDRVEDNNAGDEPEDDKAGEQSPATSTSVAPRRGLRERGVGRQKPGLPASSHTNGAVSGSGRVLRDRSTRTVPAWLKKDKSDEDEGQNTDAGASRRRKVACPRRQKNVSSASSADNAGVSSQITNSAHTKKLTSILAPPTKQSQAQSRAKASAARVAKAFAKPVCKSEPGTDTMSVEGEEKVPEKIDDAIEKKEEDCEDDYAVLEVEDPSFQDDHDDLTYQPQSREEEELSSDEDFPFSDDLNDQSYEPNSERDAPKPKRRATSRQREKKERVPAKDTEGDDEKLEIKIEGGESMEDVKLEEEFGDEVQEGPRKRGRRRKDDTTPRLPKRRKKPPVQYVRCEMEGCGTVLAHPRYLQHHIKYQHLLKKKYVCPHPSCGRLFRLQKQLLRHAKHHTDQRDYICEFCARAFKSSHNLAVHRMIHTGEKPLQCEICGFTCRQKASLNWHMKKHDADATYQFSCSICGKKFEKKDCVVAHKAKSHPEVLIAEALAANSGGLITTPASLLGVQGNPGPAEVNVGQQGQVAPRSQVGPINQQAAQAGQLAQQVGQVSHQVVLLGQDQSLHAMQVPVTIALSPIDPPSPADNQQTHLQLQMPLHFVQTTAHTQQQQSQPQIQQLTLHPGPVVTQPQQLPLQAYTSQQQQQQQHGQPQILHMTFQPVSQSQTHVQQIPMLESSQQLQTVTTNSSLLSQAQSQEATSTSKESYILDTSRLTSSPSPAAGSLHQQQADAVMEEGVVWEPAGEEEVLTGTEGLVQQVLI